MRFAVFFIIALMVLPVGAGASSHTAADLEKLCAGLADKNPSGTSEFSGGSSESMKAFLRKKVQCPSACWDVTITVSHRMTGLVSGVLVIRTDATNKCKAPLPDGTTLKSVFTPLPTPNAERTCLNGKGLPSVTVISKAIPGKIGDRREPAKSRCDPKVVSAIETFSSGDLSGGFDGVARLDQPSVINVADIPTVGGVTGNDQLVKAFVAAGVDEKRAIEIVQKNPIDAKAYIDAIGSNDEAKRIETAAKLGLNTDLSDQQRLAVKYVEQGGDLGRDNPSQQQPIGQTTFGQVPDSNVEFEKARCAISKNESGSCEGRYHLIGPPTPKGQHAYGRYQVMDFNIPNWTRNACGQAYSPGQFLADTQCQDAVFNKYFAEHVQSCGGDYNGAAVKWFSGKCHITNSNDGYTSVWKYVQKFAATFGSGQLPFGAASAPYGGGTSPFAQVNPFYNTFGGSNYNPAYAGGYTQNDLICDGTSCYLKNFSGGTSYPGPVSTGGSVPTGGQASTGGSISAGGQASTGGIASGGASGSGSAGAGAYAPLPPALPNPVVTIVAQPREVERGQTANISWTSAGVSATPPCRITIASSTTAVLADANSGSRIVRLGSSGTYNLKMQCTSLLGGILERTTTVLVK